MTMTGQVTWSWVTKALSWVTGSTPAMVALAALPVLTAVALKVLKR